MRATRLAVLAALTLTLGCSENSEEPPDVEVFTGTLQITDLLEQDTLINTATDTVRFSVQGTEYRLDHLSGTTGLCNSGGEISGFGTNSVTLRPVYVVPTSGCDSVRIPRDTFKAAFTGDSLYLGPDTLIFTGGEIERWYAFTFLLKQ